MSVTKGFTGRRHTEESKRKMSAASKGKPKSEEHRRKMLGRQQSEETRRKISIAKVGKICSEDHCKKVSEAMMGRTVSEETRRKISNSMKGRTHSEETRKLLSELMKGGNNHSWKGGVSFEPYCPRFNKPFKERVREFFGRACVECGTPENGKKLCVHHVNFNKMSCCDGTKPLFVSLCQPCHSKTNFNREYWEEHFTNMIETYYEGRCWL